MKLKKRLEINIDILVKNGFNPDRMNNNPRLVSEDQLKMIFNNLGQ